ncbi:MAG: hypothetical protein ABDH21_05365 [bacterium]
MKDFLSVAIQIISRNFVKILIICAICNPIFTLLSLFTVFFIPTYFLALVYQKARDYFLTGVEDFDIDLDIPKFYIEGFKIFISRVIMILPFSIFIILYICGSLIVANILQDQSQQNFQIVSIVFMISWVLLVIISMVISLSVTTINLLSIVGYSISGDIISTVKNTYKIWFRNLLFSVLLFIIYLFGASAFSTLVLPVLCLSLSILYYLPTLLLDVFIFSFLGSKYKDLVVDKGLG